MRDIYYLGHFVHLTAITKFKLTMDHSSIRQTFQLGNVMSTAEKSIIDSVKFSIENSQA